MRLSGIGGIINSPHIEGRNNEVFDDGIDAKGGYRFKIILKFDGTDKQWKYLPLYERFDVFFNEYQSPQLAYALENLLDVNGSGVGEPGAAVMTLGDFIGRYDDPAAIWTLTVVGDSSKAARQPGHIACKDAAPLLSELIGYVSEYCPNWDGKAGRVVELSVIKIGMYEDNDILAQAVNVAASTIGFDLVPIVPMNKPTGILTFFDYTGQDDGDSI